jgi:hypothetical protein
MIVRRTSMAIAVGISSAMLTIAARCSRRKVSQSANSASVPASMVRTTRPEPRSAW